MTMTMDTLTYVIDCVGLSKWQPCGMRQHWYCSDDYDDDDDYDYLFLHTVARRVMFPARRAARPVATGMVVGKKGGKSTRLNCVRLWRRHIQFILIRL